MKSASAFYGVSETNKIWKNKKGRVWNNVGTDSLVEHLPVIVFFVMMMMFSRMMMVMILVMLMLFMLVVMMIVMTMTFMMMTTVDNNIVSFVMLFVRMNFKVRPMILEMNFGSAASFTLHNDHHVNQKSRPQTKN